MSIKCHAIITTEIKKEYKSRLRETGMPTIILQRRLESFAQINKLKRLKRTLLKKAKQKIEDEHFWKNQF